MGGGWAPAWRSSDGRRWLVLSASYPTWLKLVSARLAVDGVEGCAEVVGKGVGGCDGVGAGLDLDGAVAAGGADELLDGPSGRVLDEAGDRQGGEHDREVGLDRVTLVVVDRSGGQVVLGHPE